MFNGAEKENVGHLQEGTRMLQANNGILNDDDEDVLRPVSMEEADKREVQARNVTRMSSSR